MSSDNKTNSPAEILALAAQTTNFLPLTAEIERPTRFLCLAPETSASYPRPRKASVPTVAPGPVEGMKRRSSSMSSESSSSSKGGCGLRILKLSPVHYGEHLEDHQQDWHEVVTE